METPSIDYRNLSLEQLLAIGKPLPCVDGEKFFCKDTPKNCSVIVDWMAADDRRTDIRKSGFGSNQLIAITFPDLIGKELDNALGSLHEHFQYFDENE